MADETLRRNLDRAFDPGPDFPQRLLLSRTMAALPGSSLAFPLANCVCWIIPLLRPSASSLALLLLT